MLLSVVCFKLFPNTNVQYHNINPFFCMVSFHLYHLEPISRGSFIIRNGRVEHDEPDHFRSIRTPLSLEFVSVFSVGTWNSRARCLCHSVLLHDTRGLFLYQLSISRRGQKKSICIY